MLTPFVKPRQVLSYLVLAIAPFFVSEICSKWSQNYSVSESQGAPINYLIVRVAGGSPGLVVMGGD